MNRCALIVAGGKGARMQSELPKQFMLLLDVPVLMHTMERFALADESLQIILVLPKDQIQFWKGLCRQMDFDIEHTIVVGGITRYQSVQNGLNNCPDEGLVAIHDGVRPLISVELIQKCLAAVDKNGSALPVLPVTQSLRKVSGNDSKAMSREGIMEVQTPQCFDLSLLKPCYDKSFDETFTDDATVFEGSGHSIHLVEGESTNLKITTPADLKIAEAILGMTKN